MAKLYWTYDRMKERFAEEGYEVTTLREEYKRTSMKVGIVCDKGHRHSMYFKDFRNGVRCAKCRGLKLTYNDVESYINSTGYKLISKTYINSRKNLDIKCPNGHPMKTSFDEFKNSKRRCRDCKISLGEREVGFILDKLTKGNFTWSRHNRVKFEGNVYEFDFIVGKDRDIYMEYDGIQHFEPIERYGGIEGFRARQKRDRIKDRYAISTGGSILRLNYKQSKLEMYEDIKTFLEGTKVPLYDMDTKLLNEVDYHVDYGANINDVAEYYKNHSMKDTVKKFNINEASVRRHFKRVYGISREEYKREKLKYKTSEHFLNNNAEETRKKYGISVTTIQKYFKEVYGMGKEEYLKRRG